MPQLTIVRHGDAADVLFSADILESAGLHIGDVLDILVGERELILRPAEDASRRKMMEKITQEVFEQRRDAYQRLAYRNAPSARKCDSSPRSPAP